LGPASPRANPTDCRCCHPVHRLADTKEVKKHEENMGKTWKKTMQDNRHGKKWKFTCQVNGTEERKQRDNKIVQNRHHLWTARMFGFRCACLARTSLHLPRLLASHGISSCLRTGSWSSCWQWASVVHSRNIATLCTWQKCQVKTTLPLDLSCVSNKARMQCLRNHPGQEPVPQGQLKARRWSEQSENWSKIDQLEDRPEVSWRSWSINSLTNQLVGIGSKQFEPSEEQTCPRRMRMAQSPCGPGRRMVCWSK
jgi:hypothetical protein